MCDEVIFRGRYLHTIEDLQSALGGGEIVPNRQCGYTEDDLLPHCCLCPVDLAKTAAKHGLRLWPSSEGEGVWILSDNDSNPEQGRYVRIEMRGEEPHAVFSAPLPRAVEGGRMNFFLSRPIKGVRKSYALWVESVLDREARDD